MQHQVGYRKLGRPTPHRLALLRNMVTSLIVEDRIETTLPKAKELRRVAERMVTLAKNGSLAARRRAASFVRTDAALKKLFTTLAERFKTRAGGYTRIMRVGIRRGDAAPVALIEYLGDTNAPVVTKSGAKKGQRAGTKNPKAAKAAASTDATPKKKREKSAKTAA